MAAAGQEYVELKSKLELTIKIYSTIIDFTRANGIIVFNGNMRRGHSFVHQSSFRITGGDKVYTKNIDLLQTTDKEQMKKLIVDAILEVIDTQNTPDKASDFIQFINLFNPYIDMEMVNDEIHKITIPDILNNIVVPDILETINNYLSKPQQTGGFSNPNKTKSKKLGKRIRKSNKHRTSLSRKTKSRKH
jgi:hypothetical protein